MLLISLDVGPTNLGARQPPFLSHAAYLQLGTATMGLAIPILHTSSVPSEQKILAITPGDARFMMSCQEELETAHRLEHAHTNMKPYFYLPRSSLKHDRDMHVCSRLSLIRFHQSSSKPKFTRKHGVSYSYS